MASRKDHKRKNRKEEENRKSAFHWLSFSALPARWNNLGSFKDYRLQAHTSGDTDFLDLGSSPGLGICFFKVESHYTRETVIRNSIIKITRQHWFEGVKDRNFPHGKLLNWWCKKMSFKKERETQQTSPVALLQDFCCSFPPIAQPWTNLRAWDSH